MRAPISTAIAIALGVVVLLAYFLPLGGLVNLRVVLVEWAVILASVALLLGIANLFYVHWQKMTVLRSDSAYSAVLLITLALTLVVVGWFGPTHENSMWIFNYIQVPIESSLMAILAVLLAYAIARMLRRSINLLSVVFLLTTVIVLLATGSPLGIEMPGLSEFRNWLAVVPAVAGARGILLGVGLGIVATGIRILMGADRPYSG